MKKSFTILLLMCAGIGANAQDKLYPNEFPLSQITLLEGPLKPEYRDIAQVRL